MHAGTFGPRVLSILLTAVFCVLLSAAGTTAVQAAPLLQEGKKTLYQRVISHPEAKLYETASESSTVVNGRLRAFTPLYVYERGAGWLNVGVGTSRPDGWIKEDKTTPWNQSMTLLFTNRGQRDPVIFFRSADDLRGVCEAQDLDGELAKLQQSVQARKADPRVVAAEPANSAVNSKSFYLMPILEMQEPYEGTKFLKVASIDPGGDKKAKEEAGSPKTGVAIVMDTTKSMGPYIDQCKALLKTIFDRLEKDKLSSNVGFAVVAFRNSPEAAPNVGYRTKIISDFTTAANRAELEKRLTELDECKASTHSYAEDSLAGIYTAVESLSWQDYNSRIILLVTDAGPLPTSDRYRSVNMEPQELNDFARQKGIWIVAVHVQTPAGKADHASAQQAYQILTRVDGRSQYQTIKTDNAKTGSLYFNRVAESLAQNMSAMVKYTLDGRLMTKPKDEPSGQAESPEAMAERLGYAMQLDYLGRVKKTAAPEVVSSWITDMDLARLARNQHVPNVEVAVMLTKAQLSDLRDQVGIIIDQAERTKKTDSTDFFQGILSASARTTRDPSAPTTGQNLAQLGVLGEFLDGLPYRSEVMLLTEEDWYRKSVGEQTAFINRLKSKLSRYEEYDRDRDLWEGFGMYSANDWVCRIPLDMLP
ncbi:MAG: vWA domain-containing protein [Desulfovibrionaceae bacterium]|nr:vWA domain-containing protein [Desulfovibrionaceae bacterium]